METRTTLDRAVADDREAARLRSAIAGLRAELAPARAALERAEQRHRLEAEDVDHLEGIGWGALLSAVRGTRTGELDRERAQEVAARYAVQSATAAVTAVEARRRELERRLARLGDTTARREHAAQAHAEALRLTGGSVELEQVLDELAALRAEATEVEEALTAARRAASQLDAALRELGSADSWSAYDTWFGGGLVSSAIKHDRLDGAGRSIASAQEALVDLARELTDVRDVTALRADLGISPATRTFDVWFDNIFSDLSVRSSIKDSLDRVHRAAVAVRDATTRLTARSVEIDARSAEMRARRDALSAG